MLGLILIYVVCLHADCVPTPTTSSELQLPMTLAQVTTVKHLLKSRLIRTVSSLQSYASSFFSAVIVSCCCCFFT